MVPAFAVLSCVTLIACGWIYAHLCVCSSRPCVWIWGTFFCKERQLHCDFNNPLVHPRSIRILNGGESWFVGKHVPYTGDLSVPQYGGAVVCHWSVILVVHGVATVIGNAASPKCMGEWGTYAGKGKLTSFICTASQQYSPSAPHCVGTAAGLDEIAFPKIRSN